MAQVLTDDGTVWPEDQSTAPAQSNSPAPASDPYNGYWLPRILGNLWASAKDVANIPNDLYSGKLDLNDPNQAVANAGRLFNAAGTVSMAGAPFAPAASAGEDILMAGMRRPTAAQIAAVQARAADLRRGAWPQTDTSTMFSPESFGTTTKTIPQNSVRDAIPAPSEDYPLSSPRTNQVSENSDAISSAIAERLYPWVRAQDPRLQFYDTGPIYDTLTKQGIDPATIMPEWAGQVAATSPRTQTPTNLRNASYLLYRRGQGDPFTEAQFERFGNPPGYAFMGKQLGSAERFGAGEQNPLTAPKQFTFDQNVQGNLASPTIDTHNIRGSIYQYDQLNPGALHPDWFTSPEAYAQYRANGGFPAGGQIPRSWIDDSLANVTRGGVKKQIEYGPMTTPWYDAAEKLGIQPAQAQAGGWFNYGDVTGLRSPVRSLTQLFGDQIYDTARTLGVPPERVLDWWSKKLTPLTQNDQAQPQQTQIG